MAESLETGGRNHPGKWAKCLLFPATLIPITATIVSGTLCIAAVGVIGLAILFTKYYSMYALLVVMPLSWFVAFLWIVSIGKEIKSGVNINKEFNGSQKVNLVSARQGLGSWIIIQIWILALSGILYWGPAYLFVPTVAIRGGFLLLVFIYWVMMLRRSSSSSGSSGGGGGGRLASDYTGLHLWRKRTLTSVSIDVVITAAMLGAAIGLIYIATVDTPFEMLRVAINDVLIIALGYNLWVGVRFLMNSSTSSVCTIEGREEVLGIVKRWRKLQLILMLVGGGLAACHWDWDPVWSSVGVAVSVGSRVAFPFIGAKYIKELEGEDESEQVQVQSSKDEFIYL